MRLTCALTVVYLLVVPASAITTHAGDSIQVDFCGFELPEWAMRGNLSSSLIVEFYTDEAGAPEEITVLRSLGADSQLVADGEIRSCLASWSLPHVPKGTRTVAIWRWDHGKGWTSLRVSPDQGTPVSLRVSGEHSPYLRRLMEQQRGLDRGSDLGESEAGMTETE